MELFLKNIGKIGDALIKINGITVIAGENNTGKSTVGKVLYCLFSAFHNINDKIEEERRQSVHRTLCGPVPGNYTSFINSQRLSKKICNNRKQYIEDIDALKDILKKTYKSFDSLGESAGDDDIDTIFNKVLSYLKLDDDTIKANVLKNVFVSEYNMQIGNVNSGETSSSIRLTIQGENSIDIEIEDNENVDIKSSIDIDSNVAYIEDPFVLDELANRYSLFIARTGNHRDKLVEMLVQKRNAPIVRSVIEEMAVTERLTHILDVLNQPCEGTLVKAEDSYAYTTSKYTKPLALSNISTGLKTFLILKTLLLNGAIEERGIIILDEPEIHLHPEWQLLFAEIIVLLQKEFGLHILLNTHSPYFLRAIQVYSAKYEIADTCKYYLSEEKGEQASITDVSECIDKIYAKLSRPLQSLEDERWQND